MDLTPAELMILGLVIERPQHGLDLERVIEQRGIRNWTDIGFSSIYYLLNKLEKRGLLEVPDAPTAPKSRRVFRATAAGREAAARTALALIADPVPVAHPLMVGLANLPLLTQAEYQAALRSRLAAIDTRIGVVQAAERAQVPLPQSAREVFSYSLSLLEAERQWLASRAQATND